MSYPNWVFSMWAFIGMCLCAIPFPWHLEAWNTGTCLYMLWTALACLNQFVNSIVWRNDAIVRSPIWCDISSRFIIGYAVAVPSASLCINRRLYYIATSNNVTTTKAEKRRAIMVDLAIGLGIPIVEMIVAYIPQGHRFNIFEEVGCWPFIYNTPVAYVFVTSWPIIIGLVSAVYCFLSIRAFHKRRAQFKELLSNNNNLNANRYFRLMCLAGIDIACTVPLGVTVLYLNTRAGVSPWKGWDDTHFGFSNIDQFPAFEWRGNATGEALLELSRWSAVICAIVFFGFFGFADEARKNYQKAITSAARRLGYSTASFSATASTSGSRWKVPNMSQASKNGQLPVFIQRDTHHKRDSFDSLTDMTVSYHEKSMGSFGQISLNDIGGALADMKTDDDMLDSPVSNTSSDAIEISSVRRPSDGALVIEIPRMPEAAVNLAEPPRHTPDTPSTPVFRNSFIV